MTTSTLSGCEASESTGEGHTINVDNVDRPKFIVCGRSGCLRPHLRPSIASAEEQAEAYGTLLPLIASGEIAPAFDRSFSTRGRSRGVAPPHRGSTLRQGDPDRRRTIRLAPI